MVTVVKRTMLVRADAGRRSQQGTSCDAWRFVGLSFLKFLAVRKVAHPAHETWSILISYIPQV